MTMSLRSKTITFPGAQGAPLAARLDYPDGKPRAFVLFAHCFTCSKDHFAAARIASELTARGFAVFRFDFTGLGMSEGGFADTSFSSNVQDLLAAASYLRETLMPVDMLIGHSLGGTAVLAAAGDIPEAKAVATIGAPSDAAYIARTFAAHMDEIRNEGEAEITLAGRTFTIKRQFLKDIETVRLNGRIAALKKALLIFHAPADDVVSLENASAIFRVAKHPKSFIALSGANHLLTAHEDAAYVAEMLSAWASRYIPGKTASCDETMIGELHLRAAP